MRLGIWVPPDKGARKMDDGDNELSRAIHIHIQSDFDLTLIEICYFIKFNSI